MHDLAVPLDEACRLLNCGRTKIFALIRAGQLRRILIGRGLLIGMDSITKLLAPPAPAAPRAASTYSPPADGTRAELKRRRVLGVM